MRTVIKTSITVQEENWKNLKDCKNRSQVINEALSLYFHRKPFLENADNLYWEKVKNSLINNDGEYHQLVKEDEELTSEILEQKLWN